MTKPGEDQESGRFLLVPPFTTNDQSQIMEDFAESLPDETLVEELNQALIGKGAFQRFEEALQKYPKRASSSGAVSGPTRSPGGLESGFGSMG